MNDFYKLTKDEEIEIRKNTTERLVVLSKAKEEMLNVMNLMNDAHISQYGKKFAATKKQIQQRADSYIDVVKDELIRRGMQ